MRRLVLSAALLASCSAAPQVVPTTSAELPVKKVILYQNGVGYFERRGKVHGEEVELRVRPDQINDVLKSLAVLDLAGGMPSSVSLPVERSGDRLAAELPPQVRNAAGMLGLLGVLRGADVTVEGEDGTLAGRVVGVEMQQRAGAGEGEKQRQEAILTLMAGEDQLRTTSVAGIRKLTIGDKALSVGLQQSLDISKGEGAWKPVALTVRLAGDATHDLILSYIHEVPVWRPAYRAWVQEGKGVQLQGWAIVDNVSGETWQDVNLTLVVGSPLSFRYNLHTPHNVQRPDLSSRLPQNAEAPPEPDVGYGPAPEPPPMSAPAPAMESADYESKSMAPAAPRAYAAKKAMSAGRPMGGARMAEAERDGAEEQARRDASIRSAQALVTGKEVGALYAYEAQTPITVPDRSAALVNIVSRKLEGEDVFLFREPESGAAPFRAVLMRNGKDSTLESGPITLYVDGTFAGEGFIGRVAKEETAFVPYAKESGFSLYLDNDRQVNELHLVRIVDGRISIEGKQVYTRTVKLDSTRDKDSVAYVKLARTGGTEIVDPPKDLVKAGGDVFLRVHVPAKERGEAKLVESTPVSYSEVGLTDYVLQAFRYYLTGKNIDDAVAGPIKDLLTIQEAMVALNADTRTLQEQREILDREQGRIQANLDALPNAAVAANLRKQLVGQMAEVSKKSADVAKRLVEDEVKRAGLNERIVVLLRQISLK